MKSGYSAAWDYQCIPWNFGKRNKAWVLVALLVAA